jgi:hypothetical protein
MLSVELREHRGSWSVSNGLLSCVSGNNCCRAHSSESEDLGSVTKSEGKFKLPVFQGGSLGIEMRREEVEAVWLGK